MRGIGSVSIQVALMVGVLGVVQLPATAHDMGRYRGYVHRPDHRMYSQPSPTVLYRFPYQVVGGQTYVSPRMGSEQFRFWVGQHPDCRRLHGFFLVANQRVPLFVLPVDVHAARGYLDAHRWQFVRPHGSYIIHFHVDHFWTDQWGRPQISGYATLSQTPALPVYLSCSVPVTTYRYSHGYRGYREPFRSKRINRVWR